jgi:hypothetical protein
MSDIGTTRTATVHCTNCGAQNDPMTRTCESCGTPLPGPDGDRKREVLELEEVWRGVAAAGFDNDATIVDGAARCSVCSTDVPLGELPLRESRSAVDTASGRDDLLVVGYECPNCGAALRVEVERSATTGTLDTSEAPMTYPAGERTDGFRTGAAPQDPVEAQPERFESAGPGTLADQADLTDEDGDDIRQYTGEPVETEEGWVIPQQQNFAGKDNIAGGGEWPDPDTPPAQPTSEGEDPAEDG